jgi:hypothetical protein
MKRHSLLFVTLVGWMIVAATVVQAQNRVVAEGMAGINNNRVDIARDKAIDNAQRNAVERVVGVMISSSTEVENFQVKMDRILSESKGFINHYKIISERREGDTYEVSIEADVGMGKLKDRLSALNLIMARKSKPRLMILFSGRAQKDAVAESAMARHFMSQGFKLVDANTFKKSLERENLRDLTVNQQAAASFGHRYGAEILIVGDVETSSSSSKFGEIEMTTNKVIVSTKVINVDTGEVLATDSETRSAPGIRDDIKQITVEASNTLAKKMTDEIMDRWSSELTNTVTVKLVVSGFEAYQDLLQFKDQLSNEIKGFKELYQRAFANGQVELDLEIRGNTQGVADDLIAMKFNDRKLKIIEITQNRIEAKLVP